MPTLGAPLDFATYEARNLRMHQLAAAPAAPVSGQEYYDTVTNTIFYWDTTQWVAERAGAGVPPATAVTQGTIQLAGSLAGVATAPTIAAGVITDVEVAAANKDGVATAPSLRTLGSAAGQAMAGVTTLNAIPLATAPVNLNNQVVNNVATPVAPTDAANKAYIDTALLPANLPPATATTLGVVQLAGSLAGSATAPTIAAGVITDVEVAAANKDGAVGVASMRTLGAGAAQAMAGNTTLNAIPLATAAVNLNGQLINGLAGPPVAATDAANKAYVDTQITSAVPPATATALGTIQLAGALTGTATLPAIAPAVITDANVVAANIDGVAATASLRTLGPGAQQAMAGATTLNAIPLAAGPVNLNGQVVNNVANPAIGTDAANRAYVDNAVLPANLPQATATTFGTVQLAGDLAGTAASPQIAAGVIVPADVNPLNVDGLAAAPSLRTLAIGAAAAQQAVPGNTTLDALATANPAAAPVSVNNQTITNVAAPVNPTDAANKAYVDSAAQGLDTKQSVRAATTANVALTGLQTVDGVALVAGDRVLVKNQTNPAENGIYVVNAAAWTRATDMDVWTEVPAAFTFVEQGTTQLDTGWVSTADAGGTLGTTAMPWTQFSSAGAVTAGAGMTQTGQTLDVVATAGGGLVVNANDVGIAPLGVTDAMLATPKAGYYSALGPAAPATTIVIPQATHLLRASQGLVVQVQDANTGAVVQADVSVAANGDVTVAFGASAAANGYRVTLIG